jgi:hypothetical protein
VRRQKKKERKKKFEKSCICGKEGKKNQEKCENKAIS